MSSPRPQATKRKPSENKLSRLAADYGDDEGDTNVVDAAVETKDEGNKEKKQRVAEEHAAPAGHSSREDVRERVDGLRDERVAEAAVEAKDTGSREEKQRIGEHDALAGSVSREDARERVGKEISLLLRFIHEAIKISNQIEYAGVDKVTGEGHDPSLLGDEKSSLVVERATLFVRIKEQYLQLSEPAQKNIDRLVKMSINKQDPDYAETLEGFINLIVSGEDGAGRCLQNATSSLEILHNAIADQLGLEQHTTHTDRYRSMPRIETVASAAMDAIAQELQRLAKPKPTAEHSAASPAAPPPQDQDHQHRPS